METPNIISFPPATERLKEEEDYTIYIHDSSSEDEVIKDEEIKEVQKESDKKHEKKRNAKEEPDGEPKKKKKRPRIEAELHCVCKRPWRNTELMIQCNACGTWYRTLCP
jgi:hypothetical protein